MSVICILTGSNSTYDSLRGILLMAGTELERMGHEIRIISLEAPDLQARLDALPPRRAETFAIAMSGVGVELYTTRDKKLFWELVRIPIFNWNCDHPSYFPRRHRIESPYVAHGYVFPDHAVFNRDHLHANGAAFAAHIGIPDSSFFRARPADRRNGRIVFAKSNWDPQKLERSWRDTMPPKLFTILFDAIAAVRGETCGAFPEIICRVADAHDIYLSPGGDVFNTIFTRLDNYTRAVRTRDVATVLLDYPVDFIGGGWDGFAPESRHARFLGAMAFDVMRENLGSYLATASLNPNVDLSVHDRVFFALAAGTVPVFDANGFSRRHLPRLERFSFGQDGDSVAAAVEAVLDDPSAAQAATATTLAEASPRFSMQRSLQDICEIAGRIAGDATLGTIPTPSAPQDVWTKPRPATAPAQAPAA